MTEVSVVCSGADRGMPGRRALEARVGWEGGYLLETELGHTLDSRVLS